MAYKTQVASTVAPRFSFSSKACVTNCELQEDFRGQRKEESGKTWNRGEPKQMWQLHTIYWYWKKKENGWVEIGQLRKKQYFQPKK
jgi:hypothetical protein